MMTSPFLTTYSTSRLIERVRAQRLVDVVNRFHVLRVVHVAEAQQFFGFADAFFGQRGGPVFFLDGVVDVLNQFRNDLVDAVVLVGGFLGRPGNDQRRAGFVDQDGVHFVDDREVMAALDAIGEIVLHVVAQIVEAEFVVRAVGDVRAIGRAPLGVAQIVDDDADRQPQRAVDRAHPFRVAPRQVIVHRDDVHAAAGERIQERGKRGDERLAFARLHLGDFAFVQHDAADQLHVEMAHAELAAARFAHQREGRHQRRFQRLLAPLLEFGIVERKVAEALLHLRPELRRLLQKLGVAQLLVFRRQRVDRVHQRLNLLEVALVLGADEPGDDPVDHGIDSHHNPSVFFGIRFLFRRRARRPCA